ncbi:putative cardiolipin synthase [Pseudidiomarina planktonica]|uniref:Putative cardiolipin synthase n=1 Tax=Pseudidiomarina planktonica TaxID=1323738 RepID=A0A1Y6E719_9GAMM|nr:phospholipase D family protein [Pseudidiomarina planktonica]RUO66369.1 phospholipase D family protein [Pseudidiomarina planktonica]SMQ58504.1 putative cardiolipin synthase [Pseudidiomarina planktonica]
MLDNTAVTSGRWAEFVNQHAAASVSSGYRLLANGADALEARQVSTRCAHSRVCIQTYIWEDDDSGRLLMAELLTAAKRGVQVYLLLDDMDVRGNDYALALLDQHPNIHIRLFNPFRFRFSPVHALVEVILRGSELNHRMHNKAWLVDGLFAVIGGRNIGDAYFDRSQETNFIDLDMAVVGGEAAAAETSFWSYWQHPLAIPVHRLKRLRKAARAWEKHPLWLKLKHLPEMADAITQKPPKLNDDSRWLSPNYYQWHANAQFIADNANKVQRTNQQSAGVLQAILFRFARAKQQVHIISPYFTPGEAGVAMLASMVAKGVEVKVLTNSLASNDVLFAHSGYAKRRRSLLAAGVKLFEMKAEQKSRLRLSTAKASLHSKALVIDQQEVFVGSFNLGARSAMINTELGIFIDDNDMANRLINIFTESTRSEICYRLRYINQRVVWQDTQNCYLREPDSRWWRRLLAWLAQQLPLESQL